MTHIYFYIILLVCPSDFLLSNFTNIWHAEINSREIPQVSQWNAAYWWTYCTGLGHIQDRVPIIPPSPLGTYYCLVMYLVLGYHPSLPSWSECMMFDATNPKLLGADIHALSWDRLEGVWLLSWTSPCNACVDGFIFAGCLSLWYYAHISWYLDN